MSHPGGKGPRVENPCHNHWALSLRRGRARVWRGSLGLLRWTLPGGGGTRRLGRGLVPFHNDDDVDRLVRVGGRRRGCRLSGRPPARAGLLAARGAGGLRLPLAVRTTLYSAGI